MADAIAIFILADVVPKVVQVLLPVRFVYFVADGKPLW